MGLGGGGACSHSCEAAHAVDVTLQDGAGWGWGGVRHVRIHVKLNTLWMLCSSQRQCFNLDSEQAAKAGVKKGCVNASALL